RQRHLCSKSVDLPTLVDAIEPVRLLGSETQYSNDPAGCHEWNVECLAARKRGSAEAGLQAVRPHPLADADVAFGRLTRPRARMDASQRAARAGSEYRDSAVEYLLDVAGRDFDH